MWPDQQPPGGAQNPQHNPYQQPGYQQPNPYQQPGPQQQPQAGPYGQQQAGPYGQQQADPYGQQPQRGQPAPAAPVPGPPRGGGRTKLVAIVAATAVAVAAAVTGYLILGGGSKGDEANGGKAGRHTGRSPAADPAPGPASSAPDDDPRGNESEKPTVEGWKVVVNPKWGIAFDVPPSWQVNTPGTAIIFDFDDEKEKGITMSGTAEYKPSWCTSDDDKDGRSEHTALAAVGTKGANKARNTDEIAINTPAWWVYGGYTEPDKKSLSWDRKATPFTTTSGIKGSIGWAQSTGTPRKGKCVTDGKALTFGFKNAAHNYVSFNFFGAKGVPGEVPRATVLKVLSTVRLHGMPASE
ncbi:hypothetical protein GCM10010503_22160 [Streptomyces lucensis JCM 4490]|uniref:DUF8017 domain-containing protein n=1 Tax=Streptomyces lucensis JCM 4490 TaxID=1306176 RepID=A0A918J318_9ACTN|nr:hypothetical protein [Streptomyces lucensis]GGW44773.1 hypothetical protein GCM10010503_22160 [Streptomyces lucensis JCM 4490]